MLKKIFLILLACSFGISACGPKSPAEKISKAFVESYYVDADLKEALTLADGLAREKVTSSLALREGQAIDASTHHPSISMKKMSSQVSVDEAEFIYEITIKPSKMEPMRKKARITVRQRDGVWKVTQFTDYNL